MARLVALGGLALVDDDGPIPGATARGRNLALLALLARAGGAGLTRDKVAALLWPESDEGRARHSLDQALYTLRRALGGDLVVTAGATLALDGRILPSDVADFEAARADGATEEVVDLYAGPFLDGFHLSGAAGFEAWATAERSRLHAAWVEALEALAVAAVGDGEHATAVSRWRRLAAAEPLSSRLALGLMQALERAGDRAGALEAARVHAALAQDELGAPPDPSIVAYEAELRRAPTPRAPAEPPAPDPGPETNPGTNPGTNPETNPDTNPAAAPATATAPDTDSGAPTTAAAADDGGTRPPRSTRSRPGRRRWPLLAAAVVGIGWLVALALPRAEPSAGPPAETERPVVLVTPFEIETGDTGFAPLGTMAADWITEGLVRTGIVHVLTTGGAAEGARSVVSGRVYRTADSVWLQARISSTGDGRVLRVTDPVGAPAAEPSRALEPLRQQVLGALGTLYDPRLTLWAETALRPPSYAAFQQLAAGLELFAPPRDLEGAAARLRRAAALDPDYVLPRLWLAWVGVMEGSFERTDSIVDALASAREGMSPVERAWLDRIEALLAGDNERSFRAARRMVDLAPRSGWVIALANAALDTHRPGVAVAALRMAGIESLGPEAGFGWFLLTAALHEEGDYAAELEATVEGIRTVGTRWGYLGPGVPALAALGRMDALERRLDRLHDEPPLDDGVPRGLASLEGATLELRAHGFADEASALVERRLASEPDVAEDPGRWVRTTILYEVGRWEEAEAVLRGLPPDDAAALPYRAVAALLAARRGVTATARAIDGELAAADRRWDLGETTFWRARIHAALGEDDTALDLLRRSFAEGQGGRAWHQVHVLRDFDPLRGSPSFLALVRPGTWPGPGASP